MTKRVVGDIGHGGADPGATGNGLIEKELNLIVGNYVKQYLQPYDVEFILTRTKDITLTADDRTKLIRSLDPDLCISIHHNSATDPGARGVEVIHAYKDKTDDKLADMIAKNIGELGIPVRRTFTKVLPSGYDYYFMIRSIIDTNTQAVIVEGGFISNQQDAELLKRDSFLKAEAEAIGQAIVRYLGLELKNRVEDWKFEPTMFLAQRGIINDPEYWLKHINDPIPFWAVAIMLKNMFNYFTEATENIDKVIQQLEGKQ
jgi:N-acetylmuramoyl-L-alanine amidase